MHEKTVFLSCTSNIKLQDDGTVYFDKEDTIF